MIVAKILMPWLFVSRKTGWTPFAKIRREKPAPRRRARRAAVRPA